MGGGGGKSGGAGGVAKQNTQKGATGRKRLGTTDVASRLVAKGLE